MAHTTSRLLTIAALAALTATLTTPTPATAHTYPGHTTSQYVPLSTATHAHAHKAGCAQARTNTSGLRILFFGTQERDNRLRDPGTTKTTATPRTPTTKAADYAHHWARGFTQCRTGTTHAHLALGVNNKSDGGVTGTDSGRRWATLITNTAQRSNTPAVTITAALDAEPPWSTPQWARNWIDTYTNTTDITLYTANSADGCPTTNTNPCNNGWTLADVHHLAGAGKPTVHVIPQIYRTDGIQARQWANISHYGHTRTGDSLRFAGAMAQHTACAQRNCTNTDNTPRQAWTQLKDALHTRPHTRTTHLGPATDMRWP